MQEPLNPSYPVLPLRDIVVFTHMVEPLIVGRDKSVRALEEVMAEDKQILLSSQIDPAEDDPQTDGIYDAGVLANVLQLLKLPDGTVKVLVEGTSRVQILEFIENPNYFEARAEYLHEVMGDAETIEALTGTIGAEFERYAKVKKNIPEEALTAVSEAMEPEKLADLVAGHLGIEVEQKQDLLETLSVSERLEKVYGLMQGEMSVLQVEKKIKTRVKSQMERTQREYYLNEQMKAIQKELGDIDEGHNEIDELKKRIDNAGLTKEALTKANAELNKLKQMSPMSAEATVVRSYIDWLVNVPWKAESKVRLDLARAESIEEFGEGVRKAGVSQHFCYADRDGNIAYWMSGRDPIRPEGEYRMPQGSVAPPLEYDIDNVRDLAHDSNTPLGYYGGWNNKASKDYNNAPIASAANYGPYHRAHVVDDYLAASDNLSFEEIRDFAIDIAATDGVGSGGNPWQFIQDEFKAAVEADSNQARNEAVALLDAWDGHFVDGGEVRWISGTDRADGWILLDVWLTNVLINTFSDELEFVPRSVMLNVLLHSFEQYASILNNYDWYTNLDPEMPQTKQEIIVQSLDEALEILGDRPWGTGLRGTIDYQHFFLGIQHRTPFANRSTYAHCVEMGANGPVRIESMFPLGQSGTIFNGSVLDPNYFSMVEFYDNFAPRSFPLFD